MNPTGPRLRRNLRITATVIVLYTVAGFFIAPPVIKSQMQKRLSTMLGRTVTVEKVRFNPYTLSLTLENFDIRTKSGDASFVGWARLYANFGAMASLTGDWVLSEIELDGFHATTLILPDGSLSFADILEKFNTPSEPRSKPGRPLRVGSLKVDRARMEFTDESRSKPFATVIGPLTFAVTEFRTAGAKGAPYHFEAVTESGEKFAWSGTISAQPLRSVGELKVENLVLAKYSPYYADLCAADILGGKLSVGGRYEMDLAPGERVLKMSSGAVHVGELKVAERGNQALAVELPSFDIAGISADALALKAAADSVTLAGGHLRVRREKDGTINLLAMLQPSSGTGAAPVSSAGNAAAAPAKLPDILVGEIAAKDFQVEVDDLAAPRPARLELTDLGFSLKNATLADGAEMPLELSLGWKPQGAVQVSGTVEIRPALKVKIKTDVTGLELTPLSPYLEQFANAQLTQGAVTVALSATAEMPSDGPLTASAEGGVTVEKFGLVDSAHQQPLAGVGTLLVKGLKVAVNPALSATVDEINLAGPYARVSVNADKTLNLATVIKTPAKPAETDAVPAADAPARAEPPRITVNRVVISGGDFSFADRSVEPNVQTAVNQFAGTITGLSSENFAKADVDLKAMVDGAGPVAITGKLDPLGAQKFVDLKIDVRNVDLQPVSPYSGKFAGYEIARGKLMLDVKFLLEGKKIDSTEVITLNQFAFGNPTGSPDATKLPVRLGVALLKDSDGKIVIDVPIQGSTDDPEFRIGRVVLRVIVNLLTKAATSPFSLLGSMFGGGGDELAYQEFSAGEAVLQPGEIAKLETMVKALANRPALSVGLDGSYDVAADTYALKRRKLAETIRLAVWERKHAVSPDTPPPDQIVVSSEENAAAVKRLFDEKFPPGTEFGAPLPKAPEVVAPPPPKKKGFFRRVVDVVTLKGLREEKSGVAENPVPAKPAEEAVASGPSLEEMTGRLAEATEVTDNDLRALAGERAKAVRDYFINVGKIDPERLFLAKGPADAANAGKGPRVFLSLQ